jgi:hypothetical protein
MNLSGLKYKSYIDLGLYQYSSRFFLGIHPMLNYFRNDSFSDKYQE